MKQALVLWIDQEERRYKLTLEALADVDSGETADHEDVEKWVESLATDKRLPMPSCG